MSTKSFSVQAIESLRLQAQKAAKKYPPLHHMLVLPAWMELRLPGRSGMYLSSNAKSAPVSFGKSKIIGPLPSKSLWPEHLSPLQAVVAEQEFTPFRPLVQEPFRIHLFFGDSPGWNQLLALAHDVFELRQAVDSELFRDGGRSWGVFYRSPNCLHDIQSEQLDCLFCTIHWWAWKAVDSPIHVRPRVPLAGSAFEADYMGQVVCEKLSYSYIDQDVFTCIDKTLELFQRFWTVRPVLPWAVPYPPPKENSGSSEAPKLSQEQRPGRKLPAAELEAIGSAVNDDSHMTPAKLAEHFHIPLEALRKRLDRWREKNHSGWIESPDRAPREAKYLYRVGTVRPIIQELIASGETSSETSSERPAKKN